MIVKDVMKKSVITVEPETTVTEAKELMNKNNIKQIQITFIVFNNISSAIWVCCYG